MVSSLPFLFPMIVIWNDVCYPVTLRLLCLSFQFFFAECFSFQLILRTEPNHHQSNRLGEFAVGLQKLFKLYDQWTANYGKRVIYYSSLVIPTRT